MKNQIFLVFDSLRWDVFERAKARYLKSLGGWRKGYTQGTYTFPAHMSFFVGKLPQTLTNEDYYDCSAGRFDGYHKRNTPLWLLSNPNVPRPALYTLEGKNIIQGFRTKGYTTVGTGAMKWFDPTTAAGKYLTDPFQHYAFFPDDKGTGRESAVQQTAWVLQTVKNSPGPHFVFINFGETHHKYQYPGCAWHGEPNPWGDAQKCFLHQTACLEYLDKHVEYLLNSFDLESCDLVIMADHGDAMGEDGLWGHGFFHKTVMEVPILIRVGKKT